MKKQFEMLKGTRGHFAALLDSTKAEALFTIPEGHNSHMLWNIMHVIVSQQVLCYVLSQNQPRVEMEMIGRFRNGTNHTGPVEVELIEFAKDHLFKTIDQLAADYEQGLFKTYKATALSYGFELQSIEDAIYYNNMHEAMHYGQIKMIQKSLQQMQQ